MLLGLAFNIYNFDGGSVQMYGSYSSYCLYFGFRLYFKIMTPKVIIECDR